jgi:hypothetical protein
VPPRFFTPDEAAEALEEVRPIAEEMAEKTRELSRVEERRRELLRPVSGNGGGVDPAAAAALGERLEELARDIGGCIRRIAELGAVVKDPAQGLLDFPALRRGEEVCLCWRVGEDEIGFWHSLAAGFAGRRPLPLD